MHPRDFERITLERPGLTHESTLGGGAAHVERQEIVDLERAPMMGRHQHAGRRARLEQAHRIAPRRRRLHRAAARGHDVEPALEAERRQPLLQAGQIAIDHRLDIGVHGRRGPALELARARQNVARGGDEELRELARDQRARRLFMRRIGEGMQEADRQRLDLLGLDQLGDRGARGREIERGEHAAVIAQALRHLAPIAARDEWRRKTQPQVEHVIAALEAHIERVAKARGHQ